MTEGARHLGSRAADTGSVLPAGALGAVVVHWRNEAEVAELVAAWPPGTPLVIVDNSSTLGAGPGPGAPAPGLAVPPAVEVRVVDEGENLGFGSGVDRGVAELRQRFPAVDWVLVLNPDVVPRPDALHELRRACGRLGGESGARVAGVVPALEHGDGRSQCQWQLQPLPRVRDLLLQTAFLGGSRGPKEEPPAGTVIEQPAAAALALRLDALEAVGGFGDAYFPAWFEDVDLAARLHGAGHILCFAPESRFVHAMGGSVPTLGYGRFLWIYYRHLVLYLRRHHGPAWAGLARALLPFTMALRALALPLRRPKRAVSRWRALVGLGGVALGALTGFRSPRALADQFSAERVAGDEGA